MAEADIYERLTEVYICPICLEKASEPKLLVCHHTFCLKCIQEVYSLTIRKDPSQKGKLMCPSCRIVTTIPKTGLEQLPVDFRANQVQDILAKAKVASSHTVDFALGSQNKTEDRIPKRCSVCFKNNRISATEAYCFHCQRTFCDECYGAHNQNRRLKNHVHSSVRAEDADVLQCSAHEELVQSFCTDCWLPVCQDCILTTHASHNIDDLCVANRLEDDILPSALAKKEAAFDKSLSELQLMGNLQTDCITSVKNNIRDHKLKIFNKINEQESVMYDELNEEQGYVNKDVKEQSEKIEKLKSEISDLKEKATKIEWPLPQAKNVALTNKEELYSQAGVDKTNMHEETLKPTMKYYKYDFLPAHDNIMLGDLRIVSRTFAIDHEINLNDTSTDTTGTSGVVEGTARKGGTLTESELNSADHKDLCIRGLQEKIQSLVNENKALTELNKKLQEEQKLAGSKLSLKKANDTEKEKVSIATCDPGDLVLLCRVGHYRNNYVVFTTSTTLSFLHPDYYEPLGLHTLFE